jgi:hypothetical protein
MKKIFLLILLVFEVSICQNKFTFEHYSVSDCYNGYQDVFFKTITYGNSQDANVFLSISVYNDKITSAVLWLVEENIQYNYNIESMSIKDFKPEVHLKSCTKRVLEINNSGFKYFDKIESENEGIMKTVFLLYNSKKKKKAFDRIEVESYASTLIKNHKINFGHSNLFFNYNKINFYPNTIKSYRRYKNKTLLESSEVIEIKKTNFSISII